MDSEETLRREILAELEDNAEELGRILDSHMDSSFLESHDAIFRVIHNIKGVSRAGGFLEVAKVTHCLEDLLSFSPGFEKSFNDDLDQLLVKYIVQLQAALSEFQKDIDAEVIFESLEEMIKVTIEKYSNVDQNEFESDKLNFLIVDDEEDILEILEENLKFSFDANYHTFSNPVDSFKVLETTDFDLIITDYRMPNMNGLEFIKSIREFEREKSKPKSCIIFLTAFTPEINLTEEEAENIYFLQKPINFKKINFYVKCQLKQKKSA